MKPKRIWELDFLRGFPIILMIFDHLMYDLKSLPAWFSNYSDIANQSVRDIVYFAYRYWHGQLRADLHYIFIALFLIVSGISHQFSRSNFKRGLKFLLFAAILSAVTLLAEALFGLQIGIVFGILHMYAFATILTALLRRWIKQPLILVAIGFGIVTLGLMWDFTNLGYVDELTFENFLLVVLGKNGYGADSFGLVPYLGVILIGTVIGDLFYKPRLSLLPKLDGKWNAVFTWSGRNSLWILLLHQPVLVALVFGVGYLFGYRL
jgi:uncharacterized membrane protein